MAARAWGTVSSTSRFHFRVKWGAASTATGPGSTLKVCLKAACARPMGDSQIYSMTK